VACSPALFQVDYVRKDLVIKQGETVETSGLGGVFPPGLVVGSVVQAAPDETELYQIVTVAPAADLARLHQVLVLVGNEKGL
jgi:rod shape-determining protein MreC